MLHKIVNLKRSELFKDIFLFSTVIFLCAVILHSSQVSSDGARFGLHLCTDILIPSLFPFMVLSSFIIQSGLAEKIGKFLAPLVKTIFHLPGCVGATILLGLLGGYPTGAIGVSELYRQKKITATQAEQLLLFTVCAGPAFVMSAIGTQLSSNKAVGEFLFAAQLLSAIILGVLTRFFYRPSSEANTTTPGKKVPLSSALVGSCLAAAKAMLNMCAFVVLFSSVLSIMTQLSVFNIILKLLEFFHISAPIINSIIPVLLEVTNGCSVAISSRAPVELIAFALSWAGLCVHFQVFSIAEQINFSKAKFFLARLIHAIFSTIITHFLFIIFGTHTSLTAIKLIFDSPTTSCYASQGSIALIVLCAVFLLTMPTKAPRRDNLEGTKKRSSQNFFKK